MIHTLTWHQRRAAQRALGLHRWMAVDEGTQCIRCGLTVDGDPDDHDDLGRCPGPTHTEDPR